MSYDYQLKRHLDAVAPEQGLPACLDTTLRVQEWAQYYPAVHVPDGFLAAPEPMPPSPDAHRIATTVLDEHAGSADFREAKMDELEERLEDCERRLRELNESARQAAAAAAAAAAAPSARAADDAASAATDALEENSERVYALHSILEDVEQVNLELCLLEKFTATCRDCFDLYISKISPQSLEPFADTVNQVAYRVQSDGPRVTRFVERLSVVYDNLRSGGGLKEKAEAKVGTSFVRKSIKYWVHPDNLTEVKCHVLRHLPIFAFPNKDGSPHNPAITSVYYDNDNMDLYTGRLLKQDEAIALRVRWYGVPTQPVVYIENKIHYEDWTGEPSTKSRFGLEERRVDAYMSGAYTLDARIKELIAKGAVPRKEIDSMDKLAKDVQRTVKERGLKPMMRTFYNRTAFQLPDSARVRLSLDEDLTFIREDPNVVGRKLINGSVDKNWRRRDVGIEWPFERLPENEVHHFPYSIMEVKLQTEAGKEPPLWARELMQSQLVEESPKFSKFVHGSVSLLEPLVHMYPYWLYQMGTDIRHRRQYTLLELTRTTVDVPWSTPTNPPMEPKPAFWRDSVASTASSSSAEASASIATRTALYRQSALVMAPEPANVERRESFVKRVTRRTNSLFSTAGSGLRDGNSRESGGGWEEKTAAAAAAGAAVAAAVNNKVSPAGAPLGYLPPKMRKLMVPTVVEPKVHFANERTFLGWTHYSLFLINGATSIASFTAGATDRSVLRYASVVICTLGVLFLLVGLYVRDAREKKITWNPEQERIDSVIPLFVILSTVTFAVAINWFAVFNY